ncbi:MAG: ROK family protein [Spirochaetia bacterium]|jgi:predicted NBD/HSP70 family sugar kinase|nr:ROK family protein [Spirochaetia bacterium]
MSPTGAKPKSLKNKNQKLVFKLFRENDYISITEAAKTIKLSKTTVIKIFEYLIQKNLIIFKGKGISSSKGGKKPDLYGLNHLYGYTISVHILDIKIRLVTTDTNANIEIDRTIPIGNNEPIENVISITSNFINEVTSDAVYISRKLLGLSIAAPGVADSEKGEILTASRFPSWKYKTPIIRMLKEKTSENFNFHLDNQIRFICLAEQAIGKARNTKNFLVFSAGSEGVGGGIIIKGNMYIGNNYLAGEIGHIRIDPASQEVCHCGGRGCFENVISYDKIINRAKELYKESGNTEDSGSLTISIIFNDSNNGNPAAMKVMEEFAELYAIGISNVCMMIDPELIIITGEIVDAGDFFIGKLREKISDISLNNMRKYYDIQYTSFKKNGSILGGAIHSINTFFDSFFF